MSGARKGCSCVSMCAILTGEPRPPGCPTAVHAALLDRAREEYRREDSFARKVWLAFARLVGTGGAKRSRLEHILEFAASMGWRRLGVASCARYLEQVALVERVARENGFECMGVTCKVGDNSFADLEIAVDSDWTLCNPLGQAMLLNEFGSDLNIAMGLCMGHDIIFQHYSQAPVTTLTVKEKISDDHPLETLRRIARGLLPVRPARPRE